uniref:Uncharacterized protein n=1 Tax=Timema poppense TaxID=170557 RepID=A0A7R9D853_TIMPO|nr:unnamed protein product [Timema poppensis]
MGNQERYTGDNYVVHPSVITSGNNSYENDPQQRTSNPLPLRTQEGRTILFQAVQNGVSEFDLDNFQFRENIVKPNITVCGYPTWSNIVLTPSLPTITLTPTATHVAGTSCSTATHAAGTSFCSTATHITGTVTLPLTATHVPRPAPYRPTAVLPYVPQRLALPGLPHVPPRFMYAAIYGVNIQEKIRSKSFVLMNQHGNEDIRVQARKIYEAVKS